MLKLGLESGDQSVLDSECKGMELGLATKILASLKKAGHRDLCLSSFRRALGV